MPKRYPQDQRERAVRMVLDHLGEYVSVFAARSAIGPKLNIAPPKPPPQTETTPQRRQLPNLAMRRSGRAATIGTSTLKIDADCPCNSGPEGALEGRECREQKSRRATVGLTGGMSTPTC